MRAREADRLLRFIVSQRVRCERCGGPGSQVAHIVRRRFNATRCDERNVWWLCGGESSNCHFTIDHFADEHMRLVNETIGAEALGELRSRAVAGPSEPLSVFWPAERARLRERCKSLGLVYGRTS